MAYGIEEFIRLQHRVTKAIWDARKGRWTLTVDDILHNRTITDEAEVIINACGFLNNWKWPEITDLKSFKGHLVHSARWDDSYSFRDKDVAIIGSGSSAIQIVPKLQPGMSVLSIEEPRILSIEQSLEAWFRSIVHRLGLPLSSLPLSPQKAAIWPFQKSKRRSGK